MKQTICSVGDAILLEKLPELLSKGDSILVKASHFMQFDKIVKVLEG